MSRKSRNAAARAQRQAFRREIERVRRIAEEQTRLAFALLDEHVNSMKGTECGVVKGTECGVVIEGRIVEDTIITEAEEA